MTTLAVSLFLAGMLTILLPCILPLLPVVLGTSVAGGSKWRPLLTVAGMSLSFVIFTFTLNGILREFVTAADIIRVGTFDVLLLFGVGFLTTDRTLRIGSAVVGGLFFYGMGWHTIGIAIVLGIVAIFAAEWVTPRLQQTGADLQQGARSKLGSDSALTSFLVGMTLGLVWAPCAGPALGVALALVRQESGPASLFLLSCYTLGAAVPLLVIGYGGRLAVRSARSLNRITGVIKMVSGIILVVMAFALRMDLLTPIQVWLAEHTMYGNFGNMLEEQLFEDPNTINVPSSTMPQSSLPKIIRAPEFTGLGTWHNSMPLTMKELRGKVVLIDFWTYSCINCIRTLPHIQAYWEKYKDKPFVLIGVHTPEFVFEKSDKNVAAAIKNHELTYPVAQDNDFGTWDAFSNHYWPAKYLIDAEGYVRYTHFGEGDYEETDEAIQSLLEEIGVEADDMPTETDEPQTRRQLTPETYLGSRSWPALGNGSAVPTDDVITYKAPATMSLNRYYLAGDWQLIDGEQQVLRSTTGEIRLKFLGGEANLVLGLEEGAAPITGEIEIDGKKTGSITIDRHDLFNLFKGAYGEHELILKLRGKGVEGYAFTFGS